jgi:HlyD family secretion protein
MPDVARDPAILARRKRMRVAYGVAAAIVVVVVSVVLARMEPAAPTVDAATLWVEPVQRGELVVEVRGLGSLVPEDTRWLPATTNGRVERILLRPGATVDPDSIILELSNPLVQQEAINARLALQSAQASLDELRAQLASEALTQQAQVASAEADYRQAELEAVSNEELAELELVSNLIVQQSRLRADSLRQRWEIETRRLDTMTDSNAARFRVQQAQLDQAQAVVNLNESRLADLQVRPGFEGVLQQVPVEVGQQVGPGANLARVADPTRLKAELRIAETQATDIEIGQPARVDTRNGIIEGRVSRKDPAAVNGTVTVDIELLGELPRSAVPDLSVDGTIQLARMDDVLHVGRPAFGQEDGTVSLFRVGSEGTAERVQVQLGRSSVTAIEVVAGLQVGDRVVLSDMSAWDGFDRVRLR